MDILAIELLLWAVLIFFFWALKDGLGNIEADIESLGLFPSNKHRLVSARLRFEQPEKLSDVMGNYMGGQIYRYAVIAGEQYEFDHICPSQISSVIREGERCIAPGLVYRRRHSEPM